VGVSPTRQQLQPEATGATMRCTGKSTLSRLRRCTVGDGYGSKPAHRLNCRLSAFASCGHAANQGCAAVGQVRTFLGPLYDPGIALALVLALAAKPASIQEETVVSAAIARLMREYEGGQITRRKFVLALSAMAIVPQAMAQPVTPPILTRTLNNVMIAVSDMKRSLEFYEKLFGTPVQQGDVAVFRLGAGPHFLAMSEARGGEKPGYLSYGMTVDNFDPDRIIKILSDLGIGGGHVTTREGTPELWVPDPDGIKIQLQHVAYGHGSGPLGDELPPMPKGVTKPAFQLRSISHVTLTVTKGPRSQEFYQKVFGLPVQAMQGSVAALAVGSGPDMIAFNTAANDPRVMAGVNHACFTIQDFDPNRVMRILVENRLEPIEYGIPALIKPLTCRTRLRQRANNGGGPTYPLGTPELYLNDPDNITLQIQDVTYCGGSGALGQICP
jgi:catechol 2,3-dioxygenase-like lactoylglutathione lyase family enzyme